MSSPRERLRTLCSDKYSFFSTDRQRCWYLRIVLTQIQESKSLERKLRTNVWRCACDVLENVKIMASQQTCNILLRCFFNELIATFNRFSHYKDTLLVLCRIYLWISRSSINISDISILKKLFSSIGAVHNFGRFKRIVHITIECSILMLRRYLDTLQPKRRYECACEALPYVLSIGLHKPLIVPYAIEALICDYIFVESFYESLESTSHDDYTSKHAKTKIFHFIENLVKYDSISALRNVVCIFSVFFRRSVETSYVDTYPNAGVIFFHVVVEKVFALVDPRAIHTWSETINLIFNFYRNVKDISGVLRRNKFGRALYHKFLDASLSSYIACSLQFSTILRDVNAERSKRVMQSEINNATLILNMHPNINPSTLHNFEKYVLHALVLKSDLDVDIAISNCFAISLREHCSNGNIHLFLSIFSKPQSGISKRLLSIMKLDIFTNSAVRVFNSLNNFQRVACWVNLFGFLFRCDHINISDFAVSSFYVYIHRLFVMSSPHNIIRNKEVSSIIRKGLCIASNKVLILTKLMYMKESNENCASYWISLKNMYSKLRDVLHETIKCCPSADPITVRLFSMALSWKLPHYLCASILNNTEREHTLLLRCFVHYSWKYDHSIPDLIGANSRTSQTSYIDLIEKKVSNKRWKIFISNISLQDKNLLDIIVQDKQPLRRITNISSSHIKYIISHIFDYCTNLDVKNDKYIEYTSRIVRFCSVLLSDSHPNIRAKANDTLIKIAYSSFQYIAAITPGNSIENSLKSELECVAFDLMLFCRCNSSIDVSQHFEDLSPRLSPFELRQYATSIIERMIKAECENRTSVCVNMLSRVLQNYTMHKSANVTFNLHIVLTVLKTLIRHFTLENLKVKYPSMHLKCVLLKILHTHTEHMCPNSLFGLYESVVLLSSHEHYASLKYVDITDKNLHLLEWTLKCFFSRINKISFRDESECETMSQCLQYIIDSIFEFTRVKAKMPVEVSFDVKNLIIGIIIGFSSRQLEPHTETKFHRFANNFTVLKAGIAVDIFVTIVGMLEGHTIDQTFLNILSNTIFFMKSVFYQMKNVSGSDRQKLMFWKSILLFSVFTLDNCSSRFIIDLRGMLIQIVKLGIMFVAPLRFSGDCKVINPFLTNDEIIFILHILHASIVFVVDETSLQQMYLLQHQNTVLDVIFVLHSLFQSRLLTSRHDVLIASVINRLHIILLLNPKMEEMKSAYKNFYRLVELMTMERFRFKSCVKSIAVNHLFCTSNNKYSHCLSPKLISCAKLALNSLSHFEMQKISILLKNSSRVVFNNLLEHP